MDDPTFLISQNSNHIMKDRTLIKQAKRLKSRERRPEVDRLDGQWSIGSYQISYAVK